MKNRTQRILLFAFALGVLSNHFSASAAGFTPTGSLNTPRQNFTATLLTNGTVLVAGGHNGTNALASAEIYNPATGVWTNTCNMNCARFRHTATLLANGRV